MSAEIERLGVVLLAYTPYGRPRAKHGDLKSKVAHAPQAQCFNIHQLAAMLASKRHGVRQLGLKRATNEKMTAKKGKAKATATERSAGKTSLAVSVAHSGTAAAESKKKMGKR
ncbi:hypothetical protein N2152v2_002105 [Parachlorella kessleri]